MTNQWCCIDDHDAYQNVVMLRLYQDKRDGDEVNPDEKSIIHTSAYVVVVILTDKVNGTRQHQQNQECKDKGLAIGKKRPVK